MPGLTWKGLFERINVWYRGEKHSQPEVTWWEKLRGLFIEYFCAPPGEELTGLRRLIYQKEGSLAESRAYQMETVIKNSSHYQDYKKSVINIDAATNEIYQRFVNDKIHTYTIHESDNKLEQIENEKLRNLKQKIADYISERVKWEIQNPQQTYPYLFKDSRTHYFRLTSHVRFQDHSIPFPTFGNTIGLRVLNVLNPFNWIDTLVGNACMFSAWIWCGLINCIAGHYKNSTLAQVIKGVIAGPLLIGKGIAYFIATLGTGSGGWYEMIKLPGAIYHIMTPHNWRIQRIESGERAEPQTPVDKQKRKTIELTQKASHRSLADEREKSKIRIQAEVESKAKRSTATIAARLDDEKENGRSSFSFSPDNKETPLLVIDVDAVPAHEPLTQMSMVTTERSMDSSPAKSKTRLELTPEQLETWRSMQERRHHRNLTVIQSVDMADPEQSSLSSIDFSPPSQLEGAAPNLRNAWRSRENRG